MCSLYKEGEDTVLKITRLGNILMFTGSAVTDQQFITHC